MFLRIISGVMAVFFAVITLFFMEEKPAMMWFLPTVFAVYAYGGNELFDKFKKIKKPTKLVLEIQAR
jgi:hypothetical protein